MAKGRGRAAEGRPLVRPDGRTLLSRKNNIKTFPQLTCMTTIYAIPDATPPFLNQIFYKNKTFDENFEILHTKYAFTTVFRDQALSTIQRIPCMTPPPTPGPKLSVISPSPLHNESSSCGGEDITINPYTKSSSSASTAATGATPHKCPTGLSKGAPPPTPKNTLYDPSHSVADTLFWSIYIGNYGLAEFQRIRTNYAFAEIQEKQKIAAFLTSVENYRKLKETKYRVSKGGVQEIQSECHTQASTTSFPVVIAMSVFYEKNIWIVDEARRVFLKFDGKPVVEDAAETPSPFQTPCMMIYKTIVRNRAKYTIDMCPTGFLDIAQKIQSEMICLDHYETSLKAPSNYKMEDLEAMARILGIGGSGDDAESSGKKWKKSELYDLVKQKCVWKTAGELQ